MCVLSKTFQDVVTLTVQLGFQYLWINGICILQDDGQDWSYHVSRMVQIFSNSVLTIAASHASSGDQGCCSSHSEREPPERYTARNPEPAAVAIVPTSWASPRRGRKIVHGTAEDTPMACTRADCRRSHCSVGLGCSRNRS